MYLPLYFHCVSGIITLAILCEGTDGKFPTIYHACYLRRKAEAVGMDKVVTSVKLIGCFNAPLKWKRKCLFHHLSISSGILWNSHKTKFDGWLFHQILLMNDWHYDNCGWRLLSTHLLNVMLWWQQNAPNSILFQLKTLSFLIHCSLIQR